MFAVKLQQRTSVTTNVLQSVWTKSQKHARLIRLLGKKLKITLHWDHASFVGKHVTMQLLWWRPLTFQCPVLHKKDEWSHRCNIKKKHIHVCNNIIIITWLLMLPRKEIPFHGHHSVNAVTLLCGLQVSKNNLWHRHKHKQEPDSDSNNNDDFLWLIHPGSQGQQPKQRNQTSPLRRSEEFRGQA